jgi:hypothetical protein
MKKFLLSALAAASLVCVAPAFAAEPMNTEKLDAITAGTAPNVSISVKNRFDSKVKLEYKNNVRLNGSDFKAAATADAMSTVPAFTSAGAVSGGITIVDPYTKTWASSATSESAGAIKVLPRRH